MSGYSACPQCKSSNIRSETHCAGVRHNGDGYGTEVFKCEDCSWETSYQYDEAGELQKRWQTYGWPLHTCIISSLRAFFIDWLYVFKTADTYYYETRGWEEKAPAPAPATPLTPELRLKYNKVKRLVSEEQARENMKMDGILPEDIDKFFEG